MESGIDETGKQKLIEHWLSHSKQIDITIMAALGAQLR
jgi:hypothetical protein